MLQHPEIIQGQLKTKDWMLCSSGWVEVEDRVSAAAPSSWKHQRDEEVAHRLNTGGKSYQRVRVNHWTHRHFNVCKMEWKKTDVLHYSTSSQLTTRPKFPPLFPPGTLTATNRCIHMLWHPPICCNFSSTSTWLSVWRAKSQRRQPVIRLSVCLRTSEHLFCVFKRFEHNCQTQKREACLPLKNTSNIKM